MSCVQNVSEVQVDKKKTIKIINICLNDTQCGHLNLVMAENVDIHIYAGWITLSRGQRSQTYATSQSFFFSVPLIWWRHDMIVCLVDFTRYPTEICYYNWKWSKSLESKYVCNTTALNAECLLSRIRQKLAWSRKGTQNGSSTHLWFPHCHPSIFY